MQVSLPILTASKFVHSLKGTRSRFAHRHEIQVHWFIQILRESAGLLQGYS